MCSYTHLLVEQNERDDDLKRKAPKLVEAVAEVDNTICICAHEVHHLIYGTALYCTCVPAASTHLPRGKLGERSGGHTQRLPVDLGDQSSTDL